MFEPGGHWVSTASAPELRSRPSTSLADIKSNLQRRLQDLKGSGRLRKVKATDLERLSPLPKPPSRTATPSVTSSRPRTRAPPLPCLPHENPFVVPRCPHEWLQDQPRGSKKRLTNSTLEETASLSSLMLDSEDEERDSPFVAESFVDNYLEQIYPTSYEVTPFSPVSTKYVSLQADSRITSAASRRLGSAHSRAGSTMSLRSGSSDLKVQLKGKRQKLLERFCTTKRAFDEFLRTIRELKKMRSLPGAALDVELPQSQFYGFLTQHFADMPVEEHEMIFRFFDTDGSGSISLSEFYAVIEAMAPVRCLADLRCRWIALGVAPCRAMEQMAPRSSWAGRRYNCQTFGQLLTKVGVWDWEEHVYIFTAVTAPNLSSTVSLAELHSALASVSPVLLVEEWQHRLELTFTTMDKAYDALQGEFQMPMDLNKFVVMAGEKWNMTSNEAKRFFRLCDFDAKEKMTRSKFLSVMEVVKPSLRLEHVRSKLRCHYSKMLGKIRGVNRQAALEQLVPLIFANFMQHLEQPTRRRSRVPEDYQRMFDELVLTHEDMTLLLQLLAPREQEPSSFWHMLKNFAPSVVLEDLCLLSVRITSTLSKETKEAQKLPSWQARQLGLAQSTTPELQTWSDIMDGSKVLTVFSAMLPGQAAKAAGARREATLIAPLAALSCCACGMALLQDKQTCLSEAKLKQMLTELFFNFTEVQVKPSLLLDLFEDSQGSRHSRGISTAEFLVAVGSMAATEGIPVDTSPEGRMSRAQMEARSQLGPFEDYALELRSAVRQKVKVPLVPKVVATGSILEPLSYVNPSCVLEAPPDREETEGEKLLEAMRKKMETLNLVKDEQLREALSAELCEKESAQLTLLREANHLPQLHQPGAAEFKAFYHHMEEYPKYVPDEELVERMRGYFYDAGGLVESQSVLLEKKQHPSGIKAKSLKLARL